VVEPPEDPDAWTHEQWIEWLQALGDAPDSDAPVRRRRSSRNGSMLGAAMMGLEQVVFGRVAKPEIVIEAEADGQDDGLVLLDPDDPAASVIAVPPR
jgi:hypothetical protein